LAGGTGGYAGFLVCDYWYIPTQIILAKMRFVVCGLYKAMGIDVDQLQQFANSLKSMNVKTRHKTLP
jgi:hypothetical protein